MAIRENELKESSGQSIYTKHLFFLLAFGVLLTLQMSWVKGFFSDGYLYSVLGKNAAEHGHWLVPQISPNTTPQFTHHSPFVFIIEGLFFKLFGASYTSARFFISLFTLSTGFFLFFYLKKEVLKKPLLAELALLIFFMMPPLLKKSRFPNLDIVLMFTIFLSLMFYWKAFKSEKKVNWILCGVFFGISGLVKGPVFILIPIIIIIHLWTESSIQKLLNPIPWFSFLIGLSLFSLWPLSLYLTGQFNVFIDWYRFTFLITIRDARESGSPFYTYLYFLFKNTGPIFLLAIYSILFHFKSSKRTLVHLGKISFLVILLIFSIPQFKYSNYIIPIYPFMAMISASVLSSQFPGKVKKFFDKFEYLVIIVALILVIFPITTKSKRDFEIFQTKQFISFFDFRPNNWIIVNNSYPYWSVLTLNLFEDGVETFGVEADGEKLNEKIENSLILVKENDLRRVYESKGIQNHYMEILYFKRFNLYVLGPKSVFKLKRPLNIGGS